MKLIGNLKKTKYKLAKIYEEYNNAFGNDTIFKKDWNNELGELIADIVYEFTADNFDITIFHACPELPHLYLSKKIKLIINIIYNGRR